MTPEPVKAHEVKTVPLDENRWQEWKQKNERKDAQRSARRMKVLLGLAVVALVLAVLFGRQINWS